MNEKSQTTLITGARVYDHDGDTDLPAFAEILIKNARIERVEAGLSDRVDELGNIDRIIDARGRLIIPGFVNAHYHSHDVLLKGCFPVMPLHMWFFSALPPQYPKRSREEVRARTLLGAAECIHAGMTTIQDMLSLSPFDEEHLDAVMDAYDDIGIRTVLSLRMADQNSLDRIPFWRDVVPKEYQHYLGATDSARPRISPLEEVKNQYFRTVGTRQRIHLALSPTSAFMSSRALLEDIADFSNQQDLPVLTHLYESRPETLGSRIHYKDYNGSQVEYLKAVGLLGPRLGLAHSIWLLPEEIEMLAETKTNVVLNPVGNMKTKSGVAPIREYFNLGVPVALGSDNSSCNDAQNMFQAMKLMCGLSGISDPELGPPMANDAVRSATIAGAGALGLQGQVGAIKVGMKADLTVIDLSKLSFVPLNSVARQMVFSESGSAVETVMVDGRIVMENQKLITIDEAELRDAVNVLMPELRKDIAAMQERFNTISPYLLEAWNRTWRQDVGVNRYAAWQPNNTD